MIMLVMALVLVGNARVQDAGVCMQVASAKGIVVHLPDTDTAVGVRCLRLVSFLVVLLCAWGFLPRREIW